MINPFKVGTQRYNVYNKLSDMSGIVLNVI